MDKLPSYRAAFCKIGAAGNKLSSGRFISKREKPRSSFRQWEWVMQIFRIAATHQNFLNS